MGRTPAPKKHLALQLANASIIAASLSRAATKAKAKAFHALAGIGGAGGDRQRRKRSEKFPLELHKKILESIWPRLYSPRRKPAKPAHVTTWQALLELRRRRFAAGEELWHPGDVIELERPPDNRRWHGTTNKEAHTSRKIGRRGLRVSFDVDGLKEIQDEEE